SLQMDGEGTAFEPQQLEVGGLNVNVLIQILTTDNFGLRDLTVGQELQPTVVQLIDRADNGNRAGGPAESLYLFGDDMDNSLRIHTGSILIIHGFNVYAKVNGTLMNLQDLLISHPMVEFDDGHIARSLAGVPCYA